MVRLEKTDHYFWCVLPEPYQSMEVGECVDVTPTLAYTLLRRGFSALPEYPTEEYTWDFDSLSFLAET